jgi:hypothetical protein
MITAILALYYVSARVVRERYREDSGRVEENTEAYIDTVPFVERWLVPAVFTVFPHRQYTQMARGGLAGGLE